MPSRQYVLFKPEAGKEFYREHEGKVSVKKIAAEFKSDPSKVTKWIHLICDDIIEQSEPAAPVLEQWYKGNFIHEAI